MCTTKSQGSIPELVQGEEKVCTAKSQGSTLGALGQRITRISLGRGKGVHDQESGVHTGRTLKTRTTHYQNQFRERKGCAPPRVRGPHWAYSQNSDNALPELVQEEERVCTTKSQGSTLGVHSKLRQRITRISSGRGKGVHSQESRVHTGRTRTTHYQN